MKQKKLEDMDLELVADIRAQLQYCDEMNTPRICNIITVSGEEGRERVIRMIYEKIELGVDSIAEAIEMLDRELDVLNFNES